MAIDKVKVVTIDTDPAQTSVKELRSQLKQLKDTMLNCEKGTQEYNDALVQAANIMHDLKEQSEELNASAMDFGQITGNLINLTGGLVAGFQAARAAMNLMGVENENVIKAMAKMQQLMALTQAIPAIEKGVKAWKRLSTAIKVASASMNGFKKALISTGIGAAVVAVGLLAANFDKLKGWITGVNEEEEKHEEKVKTSDDIIKDYNEDLQKRITLEEKIARALGKDDVEIAKIRVKYVEAEVASMKEKARLLDEEAASLNEQADALRSDVSRYAESVGLMGQAIEKSKEANEERLKAKNAEETILKIVKEELENEGKIAEAKKKKAAADKAEADKIQAEKDRQKRIEDYNKLLEELYKGTLTDIENKLREIDIEQQEAFKKLEAAFKDPKLKMSSEAFKKTQDDIINANNEKRVRVYAEAWGELADVISDKALNEFASLNLTMKRLNQDALKEGWTSLYEYEKLFESTEADAGDLSLAVFSAQEALTKFDEKTDETRQKLTDLLGSKYADSQAFQEFEAEVAARRQEIVDLITELEHERIMASLALIREQMSYLNEAAYQVADAMSLIMQSADGLSQKWVTAFEQMSSGLIEMGKNLREGKKDWSTYAQMASMALFSVGSMMSAMAEQQDEQTQEGFEQQKKYQVAAATMNMLGGIVSAWVSAMNPANSWMTVWGQIAMGAAMSALMLTTGLMQIQKIQQQQFGGGLGGGMNSGTINNIIAPVQYTKDVQGAEIEGAIKDSRVYVTETDISDTQRRVRVSEQEARY